jgi:hypothetical protein
MSTLAPQRIASRSLSGPLSRRARLAVTALAGLIGVGAIYGGIGLLTDADALGAEQSWLDGTQFPNYRVPGVVLLVVIGGGMLLTALMALRRSRFAGLAALAMGVTLLLWGVVETVTIRYQGTGQVALLGVFVVGPTLLLVTIGWRAVVTRHTSEEVG